MSHTDEQTFAPQGPGAYNSPGAGVPPQAPGEPGTTPPQKQKSWFARHKFLTALLVVVALIVLVNAFSGGEDDASTATAETAAAADTGQDEAAGAADDDAEPAEEAPAADAPGIGDAVRDGKFEFTVTEVETGVAAVGDEFLSEEAQGQFVMVHLTVSNIGDEAQMLSGSNQTLIDTEGREHSANSSAAIYLDNSDTFLNDINPGNSVDGIVVFDIPADAEPASIDLHDSMFSGGVTVSLAG